MKYDCLASKVGRIQWKKYNHLGNELWIRHGHEQRTKQVRLLSRHWQIIRTRLPHLRRLGLNHDSSGWSGDDGRQRPDDGNGSQCQRRAGDVRQLQREWKIVHPPLSGLQRHREGDGRPALAQVRLLLGEREGVRPSLPWLSRHRVGLRDALIQMAIIQLVFFCLLK